MLLFLLGACASTPTRSVNGDPDADWPSLPALDQEIVRVMEADGIAGLAACLIEAGEVVWCGGYGEANPQTGALATPSTPFMVASVSKAVAGVAVMQVVQSEALDLDAPVNSYLPFEVVHPDSPGRPITTRHLMAHSSGIVDNWEALEAHYVEGDASQELGDFLEGYLVPGGADYDAYENFAADGVGELSEYSNTGAALAAYMVQASTGTPFDDHCDAQIFAPLGMNAGWHLADFDLEELASPTAYTRGDWEVIPHYGYPDYPNGQLRADARSLAVLLAAVSQGGSYQGVQVLDPSSVEEMLRVQAPELDEDQGLMWYQWTLDGERVLGHNGGEVGVSTEILFRPSDGHGVVVLMNSEGRRSTLEDVEIAAMNAL